MATKRQRYVNPDSAGGNGTTSALSGSDAAYASLAAMVTGEAANLVTADVYLEVECATSGTADTTQVAIVGFTTDATRYIRIYASAASRAGTSWSDTKYRLLVANGYALRIQEDYVTIDGLQIGKSSSSSDGQSIIEQYGTLGASNQIVVSNCLLKGAGGTTYYEQGIYVGTAGIWVVYNTIVYNIAQKASASSVAVYEAGASLTLYNCTISGGYRGVRSGTSLACFNVYVGNTSSEDFYYGAGTFAKTNCASEDQSADDTGENETATNCVAAAVPFTTDTFANVTGGSEDFSLVVDATGLIGAGVVDPGSGLFSDDIVGTARGAAWDIGAFEYAVSSQFAHPASDVASNTFGLSISLTAPRTHIIGIGV